MNHGIDFRFMINAFQANLHLPTAYQTDYSQKDQTQIKRVQLQTQKIYLLLKGTTLKNSVQIESKMEKLKEILKETEIN